jgi:hypothetical protein
MRRRQALERFGDTREKRAVVFAERGLGRVGHGGLVS